MLLLMMPVIYIAVEGVTESAFENTGALLRAMSAPQGAGE